MFVKDLITRLNNLNLYQEVKVFPNDEYRVSYAFEERCVKCGTPVHKKPGIPYYSIYGAYCCFCGEARERNRMASELVEIISKYISLEKWEGFYHPPKVDELPSWVWSHLDELISFANKIYSLIEWREELRKIGDYEAADLLRIILAELRVFILDTKNGPKINFDV
jgi:hypothetical protein